MVGAIGMGFLFVLVGFFAGAVAEGVATYVNAEEVTVFWDPSEGFSSEIVWQTNTYETLLRYDPFANEFSPVLAESFEASLDGLTWTFHLRKEVKFHTGGEMDARAVKSSIDRTIAIGKGASFIWEPVDSIEVVDKYTVVFHLKSPGALGLIVSSAYCAYIFDPDFEDRDWFYAGHEAGTGPYMLESFEGDTLVVLKKFDDYWGGWEGKHFDKIVFKWAPEASTRRLMIESGQADFINRLPSDDIEALEANPNVNIVATPSFQNLIALFNTVKSEEYPISNPLVRAALAYTIPYDDVVNAVFGGYGRRSRGVVPFGLWGYSDRVKQYTFSPKTAKVLLARAGYPEGGFKIVATYSSGTEAQRRTLALWKAELAKLGVDLEARGMTWDAQSGLAGATDPNERQDIYIMWWWPDFAHPHSFLSGMFETFEPPLYNFSYYSNPLYDDLIKAGAAIAGQDREEAINLYVEAQNLLMADAAGIAVVDIEYLHAISENLKGYDMGNPAYPNVVFWYDCYRE
jgi:peptide/nickel transport system substrate-binding protein